METHKQVNIISFELNKVRIFFIIKTSAFPQKTINETETRIQELCVNNYNQTQTKSIKWISFKREKMHLTAIT